MSDSLSWEEHMKGHTHIDDWLDDEANRKAQPYLWYWFEVKRLPAYRMYTERHPTGVKLDEWADRTVVTCTYQGARYRCVGASRLGDIWLTRDMKRSNGYQHRVYIEECSDWDVKLNDRGQEWEPVSLYGEADA